MRQLDIFAVNSYHNSVPVSDKPTLEAYEASARSLEDKILKFFECYAASFTPPEVYIRLNLQSKYPLTSIRRAITNLTKAGKLELTGETRRGLYGRQNNTWKLKI